jgi:hypothetical protein
VLKNKILETDNSQGKKVKENLSVNSPSKLSVLAF